MIGITLFVTHRRDFYTSISGNIDYCDSRFGCNFNIIYFDIYHYKRFNTKINY